MTDPSYCALQVLCITDIRTNTNDAMLYMTIKFGDSIRKTGAINDDGRPGWNDIVTFPQSDTSAVFAISLKRSRFPVDELVGRASITVAQLLQIPSEREVRLTLQSSSRMKFGRPGPEYTATVILSYKEIDALSRARIDVDAAEQSAERMKNSGEKSESAIAVIVSVREVVDTVLKIVDKVAEIHPVFEVSWKAASALYKVVSHQYEKDTKLVSMVEQMKNAYSFTTVAKDLEDNGNVIKPKLRELLDETAKCSQFVQEYVKHSFAVRMTRIRDRDRIDGFSERYISIRGELNSVVGATAAKVVDEVRQQQAETKKEVTDMRLQQQLEYHLNPVKSDASDMSKRARCLDGTREEYLGPIMSFLFSDTTPNVLFLTGAAGSGKSTIAVTASDRCDKLGCNSAYIFFERGKSEPNSVVRTIAYQLAAHHPSIASHVAKVIGENKNVAGNTLKKQCEELLLGPLNAVKGEGGAHIIIILDALDECGSMDQRDDLLSLLKDNFARLPSKVRILVTSRPENDIMKGLSSKGHIRHVTLEHKSDQSQLDVSRYIRKTMSELIGESAAKEEGWDDKMQVLCKAADGLFIWASTAVKMVKSCEVKWEQLDALLEDIRSIGEYGLDGLYATALKDSGIMWRSARSRERFARVVGLVVLAKEEVSAPVIAGLLGLGEGLVDITLGHLQPVLSFGHGRSVHLHHASFADYLLSDERSGMQPWHIDEAEQRLAIAEGCLDIMAVSLRFNICDIESSFMYNKDTTDLRERIRKNVPPHLDYICRFWADHVCELPHSTSSLNSLLAKLRTFTGTYLLYWFEVLSLTGNFNQVAIRALLDVTLWVAPVDPKLSSFLWAAYRLASVFAFPISQSTPQIYLSAASLWRGESRVADHYIPVHPCVTMQRHGSKPTAQCIKVMVGHKEGVSSVAVASDGKRFVSGSYDCTACLWDADTGELVSGPLEGHTDNVNSVTFSRDSKFVVSGSDDGTICVWNAVTGELVSSPFKCHEAGVTSIAFSPDGRLLVSGSRDGTVCIWDVDTGKLVSGPFKGHSSLVNCVAFSQDGTRIVSGSSDGTIRVRDVNNGVVITFKGHTDVVTSVAFSPNGSRIVSGSWDETIRVWNAATGELVSGPCEGHASWVRSVAYSPDGSLVVSGSDDKTIRIWDSNTGELVSGPFEGHISGVSSVAFSPDGKRAVSGSYDRTVRIWDTDSGVVSLSPLNGHESSVRSIGFSADGKRAVSGFEDGRIRVWDTDSGELVSDAFEGPTLPVSSVALSVDGRLVVSSSADDTIRVWNASSGRLVSGPLEGHTVRSVVFSQDGNRVVSGSRDNTIRIWNASSGELVSGPLKGHTEWVRSVAFSPDGSLVVSVSYDRTIRVWDAASGTPVSPPFQQHESGAVSVALSPSGERVLTGSVDGKICIWSAATGELGLGPLEGHSGRVISVAFSLNGRRIVSGSDDKTICVWDAVSGELITTFYGHGDDVLSVASSPDGSYIYSGSKDGTIRTWYVGDGEVMDERVLKHSSKSSPTVHGTELNADQVAEIPSPELKKRRAITDWKMTEDGWVVTEKGELLTWIPEDMRATLWQDRNTALFGCRFSTKLDFSDAPVGEGWYKGFPRPEKRLGTAEGSIV